MAFTHGVSQRGLLSGPAYADVFDFLGFWEGSWYGGVFICSPIKGNLLEVVILKAKLMQFCKNVKVHSFTFLCVSQCRNLYRGINVSFLSQNTDLLSTEMHLNNPNLINFSA